MENESSCCSDANCGCHLDVFPTEEKCPRCTGRLRMVGRAQTLAFRLACTQCGYQGSLLPREELHKIM